MFPRHRIYDSEIRRARFVQDLHARKQPDLWRLRVTTAQAAPCNRESVKQQAMRPLGNH